LKKLGWIKYSIMIEAKLNLDIAQKIAEFEMILSRILPKKIFYRLLLRGKGMEFDGYRSYSPDEDSSAIDWKASTRAGTLLARQYIEEREIKVVFVVDVGDNMIFGSQNKLKCEFAAEAICCLAHTMLNANDRVGIIFINTKIVKMNPPDGGKKMFDFIVYNTSDPKLYGGPSDIGVNPSVSLIVLVSDFLKVNENQAKEFEEIGNLIETIAIMIRDPLDMTLPNINKEVVIRDIDTGEKLLINPKVAKKVYEINARKQLIETRNVLTKANIDILELNTAEDFPYPLATLLKRRVAGRDK
jgi:uncharacterized protein (DUF58 family)